MLSGAIACLFSLVSLGRSFSPLVAPRASNELVTSGMYQYMRHPFYAGLLALAFGLAAVSYNETRLVLAALFYIIMNYKAKQEEAALAERHGAAYDVYRRGVGRFFPSL
jgi:protein-S-isoprenylcysteine O-methyltransferase Ste14